MGFQPMKIKEKIYQMIIIIVSIGNATVSMDNLG